jgi:hypothetical protein
MVKKLKYKITDERDQIVHYSYNKRNAEKWKRDFGKKKNLRIKKLGPTDYLF